MSFHHTDEDLTSYAEADIYGGMPYPPRKKPPVHVPATPVPGKDYAQIRLQLPGWYLGVLQEEADALGLRRGQVLELLLRRKAGLLDTKSHLDIAAHEGDARRRADRLERIATAGKKGDALRALERPSTFKSYKLPKEFGEDGLMAWYLTEDLKKQLDGMLGRLGNMKPSTWVVLALHEWLGLPGF